MDVLNPVAPQFYHHVTIATREGKRRERVARRPSSYACQLRAFAGAVLRGESIPTGPEDAVKNMRVIDAVYRAAGLPPRGEARPIASGARPPDHLRNIWTQTPRSGLVVEADTQLPKAPVVGSPQQVLGGPSGSHVLPTGRHAGGGVAAPQVAVVASTHAMPSPQHTVPQACALGQQKLPLAMQVSPGTQQPSPHGESNPWQQTPSAALAQDPPAQQVVPQRSSCWQHWPSPEQTSPDAQQSCPQATSQHVGGITPSWRVHDWPGWQHVPLHTAFPGAQQTRSVHSWPGWQHAPLHTVWPAGQQVPFAGMHVSAGLQQDRPAHPTRPGPQHSPVPESRQVSRASQHPTPHATGQQGAPIAPQASMFATNTAVQVATAPAKQNP